jgi:hypothetical protein
LINYTEVSKKNGEGASLPTLDVNSDCGTPQEPLKDVWIDVGRGSPKNNDWLDIGNSASSH